MAAIELSTITIPTPEPYAADHEHRQQENLCYVLLQMLTQAKATAAAFTLGAAETTLSVDLTDLIAAVQDLQFNQETIDLGQVRLQFDHKTINLLT